MACATRWDFSCGRDRLVELDQLLGHGRVVVVLGSTLERRLEPSTDRLPVMTG